MPLRRNRGSRLVGVRDSALFTVGDVCSTRAPGIPEQPIERARRQRDRSPGVRVPSFSTMVEMRSRMLAANLCERIAVHSRDAKRGDHHAFVTPPSFRKKLGYATWFVLVLILEYLIIRKQTEQWAEYREVGVVSSFKLRTQWLKMLLYLIIDVATLRNLRALPSMLGQSVRIGFPGKEDC